MHSNAILHEVQQLYNVSDRLDLLAGEHPLVSEALIKISRPVDPAKCLEMSNIAHSRDWRKLHYIAREDQRTHS